MVLSDSDVDDALSAHARLPMPHTMHEVVLPPVPQGPEPEGPQTGVRPETPVRQLEQVPVTRQLPSLREFEEAERRRILGDVPSQEMIFNRRQGIISELNPEDYMDSEPDEEYLQDDEEYLQDEEEVDEINEEEYRMPEDPETPLADDPNPNLSLQIQIQEADNQGERRSEKPRLRTVQEFFTETVEQVACVQYCNLGTPAVNGPDQAVPAAELTSTEAVLMGGPNDPTTPVLEETHTVEIIKHVNPASSGINARTLGASPAPTPLLPGASSTVLLCESSLDLPASAATGRISEDQPLQKPAATASISEGESVVGTSCLKSPSAV